VSVTENAINFNSFEKEIYKKCCKMGCETIKMMLELWDEELSESRDRTVYRNKGKRKTTIKTIMGEIEYERRVYEYCDEEGNRKCVYLLDEAIDKSGSGFFSGMLSEQIVQASCENSYREAAREISELTGQMISHTAAWKVVQEIGERVDKQEEVTGQQAKNNQGTGEVEAKVLFEEQDGVWLNLQGKDRKIHGSGKEMKVAIAYDGAKEEYKKSKAKKMRYKLTNKVACANFEGVKKFQRRKEGVIAGTYNVDEIEMRFLNGDGASWIKSNVIDDVHFQLDPFHRNKAIKTYVKNPDMQEDIKELLYNNDIENLLVYIEALSNSVDNDDERQNLLNLLSYYTNNKDGLVPIHQRGINIPEPPKGKEYRTMGTMESNIFTIIGNRMKGRRACWSIAGGNNLARLLCLKHTGKLPDTLQNLTTAALPEKYAEEILVGLSPSSIAKSTGKGYDGYHKAFAPPTTAYKWLRNISSSKTI